MVTRKMIEIYIVDENAEKERMVLSVGQFLAFAQYCVVKNAATMVINGAGHDEIITALDLEIYSQQELLSFFDAVENFILLREEFPLANPEQNNNRGPNEKNPAAENNGDH